MLLLIFPSLVYLLERRLSLGPDLPREGTADRPAKLSRASVYFLLVA
jgi:hypothetical protein